MLKTMRLFDLLWLPSKLTDLFKMALTMLTRQFWFGLIPVLRPVNTF